jgi:hypothetical protein
MTITVSVAVTSAALDPNNPGNIILTFTGTYAGGALPTETQTAGSSNWTTEKAVAYQQTFRDNMLAKLSAKATAAAFLPTVQSWITNTSQPVTG